MKILITALLSFLIAFSPMSVYAAEPSTEIEVPEFDSVTGDTSGMHKEIKPVRGTGTTLENCAPGKLKFYSIKGKTQQDSTTGKQLASLNTSGVNVNVGYIEAGKSYTFCFVQTITEGVQHGFNLKYNIDGVMSGITDVNFINLYQNAIATFTSEYDAILYFNPWGRNNQREFMLVEGTYSEFIPFEPYTGGDTPNPLHPQKYESVLFDKIKVSNKNGEQNEVDFITSVFLLNGIGNVRDEITDSKMIQRIGEIVFDGSDDEKWTLITANGGNQFSISIPGNGSRDLISTHFRNGGVATWSVLSNYAFMVHPTDFTNVRFRADDFGSIEEWKKFLAESPMSVLYELKEPIETELAQSDIFNFGWLDTYEGTNYISFVGSPLVPDIEVEYSAYFEKIYDSGLQSFVSFMKMIFEFVSTEFTIWGFTFSYWQIIVLTCLAGIAGYFIREAFGG